MKRTGALERDALSEIARLMAVAARTAPKTRGIDNIIILAIENEKAKSALIARMKDISGEESRPSFARDADSIKDSGAIIIIGVKYNPAGLNCGFCGYATCAGLQKTGGVCAYNSIDLGIAVSSAACAANHLHADNRIMYSIGRAAIDMKFFPKDVRQALGIPLSATGKNPYFDRK